MYQKPYCRKAKEGRRKKYYCGVNGTNFQFSRKVALAHNIFIYLAGDAALKQDREVFSGVVRFK